MTNHRSRKAIATEVRVALARKGSTQADLARATGISKATLSRKMRGLASFTVDELVVVAVALGVDAGALIAPAIPAHTDAADSAA